MAQTGRVGGRQSLENTRTSSTPKPPSVEQAPEADRVANASIRRGTPNTNRIGSPERPPEQGKAVTAPAMPTHTAPLDNNRNSRRGPN